MDRATVHVDPALALGDRPRRARLAHLRQAGRVGQHVLARGAGRAARARSPRSASRTRRASSSARARTTSSPAPTSRSSRASSRRRKRSRFVQLGWDVFQELRELPFPTTAMVNGFCMGGGVELALACRYRVALDDPKTRFALPEVMLGIMPAWHGVQWLPKLVGPAAALDMLLTGKSRRCAPREAHGPRRPGGAAAHPREHRAHGHAGGAAAQKQLALHESLDAAGPLRGIVVVAGAQAGGEARAPRALPRAVRDPRARGASTTAIRSRASQRSVRLGRVAVRRIRPRRT